MLSTITIIYTDIRDSLGLSESGGDLGSEWWVEGALTDRLGQLVYLQITQRLL